MSWRQSLHSLTVLVRFLLDFASYERLLFTTAAGAVSGCVGVRLSQREFDTVSGSGSCWSLFTGVVHSQCSRRSSSDFGWLGVTPSMHKLGWSICVTSGSDGDIVNWGRVCFDMCLTCRFQCSCWGEERVDVVLHTDQNPLKTLHCVIKIRNILTVYIWVEQPNKIHSVRLSHYEECTVNPASV